MIDARIADALGSALLHSLPQGAVLAGAAALSCAWTSSPRVRNALRGLALAALGAAFLLTFAGALGAGAGHRSHSPLWAAGEAAQRPRLLPLLALAWVAGASLALARLALGWRRLAELRAVPGRALPPEAQRAFLDLARRLGVRAGARVVDAARLAAPIVVGALRPLVLVPAQALSGLSAPELEALLAHELAHVRRLDYALNLLLALAEALFFYHPAVWFLGRGLRCDRELACDDVAVGLTRDPLSFARALARVEALAGEEVLFGVSAKGGPLMKRIRRLLEPQEGKARRGGALLALLSTATLTGVGLGAVSAAQEAAEKTCCCCCCCLRATGAEAGAGQPAAPRRFERGEAAPETADVPDVLDELENLVLLDPRTPLRNVTVDRLPVLRVPNAVLELPALRSLQLDLPDVRVELPEIELEPFELDLHTLELPALELALPVLEDGTLDLSYELPKVEWPRLESAWPELALEFPGWPQVAWPKLEVEGIPPLPEGTEQPAGEDALDQRVRELRRSLDALRREAEALRKELREARPSAAEGSLGP